MNAIPGDWSLAPLLLFGGASTALAAWAAVLIAESWFQKMRQRREHFKAWQDGYLKMWQDRQRESFLSLSSDQEKAQSRSKPGAGCVRIGLVECGAIPATQKRTSGLKSAKSKSRRPRRSVHQSEIFTIEPAEQWRVLRDMQNNVDLYNRRFKASGHSDIASF